MALVTANDLIRSSPTPWSPATHDVASHCLSAPRSTVLVLCSAQIIIFGNYFFASVMRTRSQCSVANLARFNCLQRTRRRRDFVATNEVWTAPSPSSQSISHQAGFPSSDPPPHTSNPCIKCPNPASPAPSFPHLPHVIIAGDPPQRATRMRSRCDATRRNAHAFTFASPTALLFRASRGARRDTTRRT